MTQQELQKYLNDLSTDLTLDRYVPRRFTAATDAGSLSVDLDYHFRGILREREPQLDEILNRDQIIILAEPGGGKSVIAHAAVHELIKQGTEIPIFAELKQYRGKLDVLLRVVAPAALFDPTARVDGNPVRRAYVLDGVDEIPSELLARFAADLSRLHTAERDATILLTARQAFYVANRSALPPIASVFHILDFSDEDIGEYVERSGIDAEEFQEAVQRADATEEMRNPFILSVMVERYRQAETLSDRRSENLSYMIDRLIQSRPRFNQHRQRRALRMLAVAMETYARNELTEDEALRVIKEAMRISEGEARDLLTELYASILKRTANGLAFQMRSYGEYLAAEALEEAPLERVRELAFLDYKNPNESWLNTVSYLAELNASVRTLFVRQYPFWMISASPAVFSTEEKDTIVTEILRFATAENQYLTANPRVNVPRLSRFVTTWIESELATDLVSKNDIVRGNALVLLGIRKRQDILPIAVAMVKDRALGVSARYCGIVALVNVGDPGYIPELAGLLDQSDDLSINILDAIGALADEAQLRTVLPLVLASDDGLSSTYYHFRQMKSRGALLETLRYFHAHPNDLNSIRAEGYVEPILKLLPRYWDAEIAQICADLIEIVEEKLIYPEHSGPLPKLFDLVRETDNEGLVARLYFQKLLDKGEEPKRRIYYIDQTLASLTTDHTAEWLIEKKATPLIKQLAPYLRGQVREILRPHSEGIIDAQDVGTKAYVEEEALKKESRNREIAALHERLLSRTIINEALTDFSILREENWPKLSDNYRHWLMQEVSKLLRELDLPKSIVWKGDTLWQPRVLPLLLRLIDKYELRIDPDEPIVYTLMAWETVEVANYYQRFGLSEPAQRTLEWVLANPPSSRGLDGLVRFLAALGVWTCTIEAHLVEVVQSPIDKGYVQVNALNILHKHEIEDAFLDHVAQNGASKDLRQRAFELLVERQHRPTIERALARLRTNENEFRAGEVSIPHTSPHGWIGKIRGEFAFDKLAELRATALHLELPQVVGLVTETLANIDRAKTAKLIRQQIDVAPKSWRHAQQSHAIEQERTAKIERAQQTVFDVVLKKLKGATSLNRLLLVCEGSTDNPVFHELVSQISDVPEIIIDAVGGWPALRAKDPHVFLLGCRAAMVVMDGDEGRQLNKRNRPLTRMAREEQERLAEAGVELIVLQRYGIENYFPRAAMEKVLGVDLSAYFPIPEDVSVLQHLSRDAKNWKYRLRRWIASVFDLRMPAARQPLYWKSRNSEVAEAIVLDRDLVGTDLFLFVHRVVDRAREVAES